MLWYIADKLHIVSNYLRIFTCFSGLCRYVLCNRSRFIWTFLHESKNWCLSKQQRTNMEPGMLNVFYLSVNNCCGSSVEAVQSVAWDSFSTWWDEMMLGRWSTQIFSCTPEPPAILCNLVGCCKRWLKPRFCSFMPVSAVLGKFFVLQLLVSFFQCQCNQLRGKICLQNGMYTMSQKN